MCCRLTQEILLLGSWVGLDCRDKANCPNVYSLGKKTGLFDECRDNIDHNSEVNSIISLNSNNCSKEANSQSSNSFDYMSKNFG